MTVSHRWRRARGVASAATATAAATLVGCSFHAGAGGTAADGYFAGQTQSQVMMNLSPRQRVLFRDEDLMIIQDRFPAPGTPGSPGSPAGESPSTTTLRFHGGRLETWSR